MLELTLWSGMYASNDYTIWICLNPSDAGIDSLINTPELQTNALFAVLILLMLELTLWCWFELCTYAKIVKVLILLMLELTLWYEPQKTPQSICLRGLNPSDAGIDSLIPYCKMWKVNNNNVLILLMLELTLWWVELIINPDSNDEVLILLMLELTLWYQRSEQIKSFVLILLMLELTLWS